MNARTESASRGLDDPDFEGVKVSDLGDPNRRYWIAAGLDALSMHRPAEAIGIATLSTLTLVSWSGTAP